ncbi:MAG: response regulator transcription factor [Bacilli bacterium]|jgi:two-component system response regulator protein BraR/BceR|nr:response regulator transcription factor [Bacilli bacterium]MCX4253853.1 response regulator transcription factor [Bacilli bacterium]
MHIMIIEDDAKIRAELAKLLNKHGYQTSAYETYYEDILRNKPDLILLDINLPNTNGFKICQKIKQKYSIPIIFVTSRNTDEDELLSIKAGGIDFITKPYNKSILLEKIKRALNNTNPKNYKEITKKGYTLDLHLAILKFQDQEVELTRNEFRILYYFFLNSERIISKDELLEYLWNDKYYLDETILLVNINRVRKKASDIGIKNLLTTIRGQGYKL